MTRLSPLGALGRWREKRHGDRAGGGGGDVDALEREGDPRGGLQNEAYRHAAPDEVVEADGVVMAGPGGAPRDQGSIEERREHGQAFRSARENEDPTPQNPGEKPPDGADGGP